MKYISTKQQKADILTKALSRVAHENARKLTMGW